MLIAHNHANNETSMGFLIDDAFLGKDARKHW